ESVARTTTPIVTSRSVPATVVAASFWKRVTNGILAAEGADERPPVGCPREPPSIVSTAPSRHVLGRARRSRRLARDRLHHRVGRQLGSDRIGGSVDEPC